MLIKIALTEPCVVQQINGDESEKMVKTASGRIMIEKGSEKERIVKAEIKKHPNALFFRAKAIKADEPNSNGDSFSKDELLKAYKSFEGVPFFTNHENQDIEKAKGKIIFAEWDEDENSVYTIAFVDRDAYPHICRGIEQGYMTGVSMGASVEYSVCNICGNKAERTEDYCSHIQNRKSRKFTGRVRDVRTGEMKDFKDELVFEHNYGIKFIELSGVVDPACPSCHIQGIIKNDDYLEKIANIENSLRMMKTSAIEKKASQEELEQINEVLQTLEDIAVNLIKNRQQVEVEFASDLVGIIENLQTFLDELTGAGYGSVQSSVPGTLDAEEGGLEEGGLEEGGLEEGGLEEGGLETPLEGGLETPSAPSGLEPTGVSSEQAMEVGTVSGAPGNPAVNAPQLPITSPIRPAANLDFNNRLKNVMGGDDLIMTNSSLLQKVSKDSIDERREILQKVASLSQKIGKTGVKDMGKRRTVASKEKQKEKTIKVLSNSWQEKQDFFEYIKEIPSLKMENIKISVKNKDDSFIIVAEDSKSDSMQIWTYEDLSYNDKKMIVESPQEAAHKFLKLFANNEIIKGVKRMSKNTREAGADTVLSTPDVITEKQQDAESSKLYHGRTGDEQHVITQKQLDGNVSYPRKGESDVITEKQLDGKLDLNPRQSDERNVITEKQLQNDTSGVSARSGDEIHSVTQAQLDSYRASEQNVITEKQLSDIDPAWARQSSAGRSVKTASDHMKAVINALAEVSVQSGATPSQLKKIAGSLVSSHSKKNSLYDELSKEADNVDSSSFVEMTNYWQSKNVKLASLNANEITSLIVNKLRVVASDPTISRDIIVDSLDVISDSDKSETVINKAIDSKLAEASDDSEEESVVAELKTALEADYDDSDEEVTASEEDEGEEKLARDIERKKILAKLNTFAQPLLGKDPETGEVIVDPEDYTDEDWEKDWGEDSVQEVEDDEDEEEILNPEALNGADIVIETSFDEIGTQKTAKSFKKDIVRFAKNALSTESMKLASITNVTIDGDVIQIAVQTDNGSGVQEVQIPIGQQEVPAEESLVPEGDLAGEGLEGGLEGGLEEELPPLPEEGEALAPAASNRKRMRKMAQAPMGGGVPGTPGETSAPGAPEAPMEGIPGGDDPALQAITTGDEEDLGVDEDIPTVGEKQVPWSICPECGSADVDVTSGDGGEITGSCNACSAEYEALVKKTVEFTVTKPTKSVGEEGIETPEAPEGAAEMPALPVAAQTKINKGTIMRIAKNKKKFGEVCPSCGNTHCDIISAKSGSMECLCKECKTNFKKNIVVSSKNPSNGILRVEWELSPSGECKDCKKEAQKFASKMKVANLLKTAAVNGDKFPMANCMERIARTYGGNTVAQFGPCKGKPMAECVCTELKKLGFTKVRHMNKLAEASMQQDPMEQCVKDHKKKGHSIVEAKSICNCIKKKFASEIDDNIYVHAFADEAKSGKIDLSVEDLKTIHEIKENRKQYLERKAQEIADEEEIGEPLPDAIVDDVEVINEVEGGEDSVTIEISGDNIDVNVTEIEGSDNVEVKEEVSFEDEDFGDELPTEVAVNEEEEIQEALAMNSSRIRRSANSKLKIAGKPKLVEDIEGHVDAGVPRGNATIRNESPANFNKPSVPRGNATMGSEENFSEGLPNVAVDSSYIGGEKETQKGMPGINNDIKGTVIAKKMKEVSTVEGDVDAGVPRGDATIGHEGSDNIDVKTKDVSVPRGDATMGNEEKANLQSPDVPIDNSFMGNEKDSIDGPINDEYLTNVAAHKRSQQIARIAQARREEAVRTTAWLASNGRIASDKATFDNVVNALSSFEIDKIASVADSMFPVKTASQNEGMVKEAGAGIPAIVLESTALSQKSESFEDKLKGSFTIGSHLLNDKLIDDNER